MHTAIEILPRKVTTMHGLCFPTLWRVSQLLQKGQTKLACDDGKNDLEKKYKLVKLVLHHFEQYTTI